MGEVAVGDLLIGADGQPTTVVAATEVMRDRPCFEVEFSDGEVIVADADHQWLTWDADGRIAHDAVSGSAQGWADVAALVDRRSSVGPVSRTTAELAGEPVRRRRAEPQHSHLRTARRPRPASCRSTRGCSASCSAPGIVAGSGRVVCAAQDREWVMKEFDRLGYHVRVGAAAGQFTVDGVQQAGANWGCTRDGTSRRCTCADRWSNAQPWCRG